jgi:ABC-type nickel/cobalt efflux system permease component RcnA
LSIIFILIGISFFYGVVHALGPGHGKSIAASYFLSTEVPLSRGLLMGGLIALLHAGSAIVVVSTLYLFLRHSYLCSLENVNRVIRIVSHTLIASVGLLMFITAIRDGRKKQLPIHNGGTMNGTKRKSLFSVALAVGIVPCPGAVLILLFCLSMGILTTGILLALVMGIGMGLTISAVGSTVILTRQGFSKFLPENSKTRRVLLTGLRLFGSLLIFFIGGIFLLEILLSSIG